MKHVYVCLKKSHANQNIHSLVKCKGRFSSRNLADLCSTLRAASGWQHGFSLHTGDGLAAVEQTVCFSKKNIHCNKWNEAKPLSLSSL